MKDSRISGTFLATTLIVLLIAVALLFQGNAIAGYSATIEGDFSGIARNSISISQTSLWFAIAWITQLLGLTVLLAQISKYGSTWSVATSLVLIGLTSLFGIAEATFNAVVVTSVSLHVENGNSLPVMFPILDEWVSQIKFIYLVLGSLMHIFIGLALRSTNLFASWMWILPLVWGVIWTLMLIFVGSFPAVLFVVPIILGIALISSNRNFS